MTPETAVGTPSRPLRIGVLGAGRIGSTFALQLARAGGHDVTVVARPDSERLRQLQGENAIVDVKGDRASVKVLSELDEQTPYDLLIVTLMAHQVDASCRPCGAARPSASSSCSTPSIPSGCRRSAPSGAPRACRSSRRA